MRRLPLVALLALAAAALIAPGAAQANGSCPLGRPPHFHEGTLADPIPIATVADFETFASQARCYNTADVFLQTADLDLGGVARSSIGSFFEPFTGTYDGGGHRITGLLVTEAAAPGLPKGLFGQVSGGTITRLVVDGARIEGGVSTLGVLAGSVDGGTISDVTIRNSTIVQQADGNEQDGGLVGAAVSTTIERVVVDGIDIAMAPGVALPPSSVGGVAGHVRRTLIADATVVRGSILGRLRVGGIVGSMVCSRLERSSAGSAVTVAADAFLVGGAIGSFDSGYCDVELSPDPAVVDVSAAGPVTAGTGVGGLIGQAVSATVLRSAASGAVTATVGQAGGLIGWIAAGGVTDSYALGAVTASGAAGGLVGAVVTEPPEMPTLTRTYAAGRVTAGPGAEAGGLLSGATVDCILEVGLRVCSIDPLSATVTASFWDAESTGQSSSSGGGAARTTAQMREIGTFSGAGWSIASGRSDATTWGICGPVNGGRPFLQREYTGTSTPCAVAAAPAVPVAAASTAVPKAKLVVTSTQRAGRSSVTRVRVSAPGTVTQVGRALGSGVVACRATPVVMRKAGTAVLTCKLTAAALRRLRYGALRVRLVTRFTPTGGTPVTTVRVVRFARIAPAAPVTG